MLPTRAARALTRAIGSLAIADRRARFRYADAGHGYDRFGLQPDFVALADLVTTPVYERYFRVRSYGHEHLPSTGAAIVAANHSGTLPFDAAMLWADIYRHTDPPRAPRAIADYFVPSLPYIGTLFARTGMVGGSRGNARALLEAGELLMLFPEGTPGIGKPFRDRYRLQAWREGHCELAIRHRAPVIPVGIVGPEEQMPQIARLPGFGPLPYLPIPATPLPLPVRYHIHYGAPIPVHEWFTPDQADDPACVRKAAAEVKRVVQELLHEGLRLRSGIFS
jgi:1-acyl-sn-glycerol-3-phosphate acyltransferase